MMRMNESLHLVLEIALNRHPPPSKCLIFGWLEKVAQLPCLVATPAPCTIFDQGTFRTLNFLKIICTPFFPIILPTISRNGRVASAKLLICFFFFFFFFF